MTPPKKRVGISGSYGGLNLGDEAILTAIIAQLRHAMPIEITVFSRDADNTRKHHAADHVVQARELSRYETIQVLKKLDLFILGGGGILYDAEAETYLREVFLAHEAGVPIMVYAVSAGPLTNPGVRSRVREGMDLVEIITVRDRQSLQLFEEIGIAREVLLTADPAVLIEPEPLSQDDLQRAEAFNPEGCLIGLSVRELGPAAPHIDIAHYHRLVANSADFLIDRFDAEVVFFPLERRNYDVQHSHGVVAQMSHAQKANVLKGEYSPGQLVSMLKYFDFAVGMRLHFLIFSALANIPFMGLPYATKISGFLEELRLETLGFENISAGQLIARIDRAWETRNELSARIDSFLQEMKNRARMNNEVVMNLLSK
ncbi:MAG: polysaccharide pyruvyl transferase [Desulfobacteraceae bacterium]|nr:MAG: polysaccharide pyruvyl transferase [Desulfobacteraceae bacterium]